MPSPLESVPGRSFTPVEQACEVCGARAFEALWPVVKRVRTRSSTYVFDHHVGACRSCGFVYVAPGYLESELAAYYQDSFANWLGVPNYTWEQRLAFIRRHCPAGGTFLEIGGNNDDATVDVLARAGFRVLRFDQNTGAPRDYASLADVPDASLDVVAHYYTLEHTASASAFMRDCRRMLAPGGLMICEVPDLDRYSFDPAEQLGAPEHMRHFNGATLVQLAVRAGFEAIELSYRDVSKPCGFAAAFRNSPAARTEAAAFAAAATRVREGATLIAAFDAQIDALAAIVRVQATLSCPVVLWGANPITAELVGRLGDPGGAVIALDDDPLKAGYFATVPVLRPDVATAEIERAAFMVSSRRHLAPRFLERARALTGRTFAPEAMAVLDHGYCAFDAVALANGVRA